MFSFNVPVSRSDLWCYNAMGQVWLGLCTKKTWLHLVKDHCLVLKQFFVKVKDICRHGHNNNSLPEVREQERSCLKQPNFDLKFKTGNRPVNLPWQCSDVVPSFSRCGFCCSTKCHLTFSFAPVVITKATRGLCHSNVNMLLLCQGICWNVWCFCSSF